MWCLQGRELATTQSFVGGFTKDVGGILRKLKSNADFLCIGGAWSVRMASFSQFC